EEGVREGPTEIHTGTRALRKSASSLIMQKIRQLISLCALLACATPSFAQQQVDVLIRGGSVVDGTGSAPRRADVGVRGDRITFVGDAGASRVTATKTIDASGLVVAPGLIHPHTHTQPDL